MKGSPGGNSLLLFHSTFFSCLFVSIADFISHSQLATCTLLNPNKNWLISEKNVRSKFQLVAHGLSREHQKINDNARAKNKNAWNTEKSLLLKFTVIMQRERKNNGMILKCWLWICSMIIKVSIIKIVSITYVHISNDVPYCTPLTTFSIFFFFFPLLSCPSILPVHMKWLHQSSPFSGWHVSCNFRRKLYYKNLTPSEYVNNNKWFWAPLFYRSHYLFQLFFFWKD